MALRYNFVPFNLQLIKTIVSRCWYVTFYNKKFVGVWEIVTAVFVINIRPNACIFTARCTLVQSTVLRSLRPSVCLSVRPSVTLVDQDHTHRLARQIVIVGNNYYLLARRCVQQQLLRTMKIDHIISN